MKLYLLYWTFYQPSITTGGAIIGVEEITKCDVFKTEEKREKFLTKLNQSASLIGVTIQTSLLTKDFGNDSD